jgi:hypothetical protein
MTERRPAHRCKITGAAVFPEGNDPAELEPLPARYWADHDKQMAVTAIKAEASKRILDVAPLWRQIEDLKNPLDPGAVARNAEIMAIQEWSNKEEGKL